MISLLLLVLPLSPLQEADRVPDEKIRDLIEQLGADYEEDREAARTKLEKVGARGEPFFIEGLDHDDYRVRKICLDLLNKLESKEAFGKAARIFRDKSEEKTVQAAAFQYLRRCGAAAEPVFIEALDHAEEAYRLGALDGLIELKSTKAADKAAALYEKDGPRAQKDKAYELLKLSGEAARPHLIKLLKATDSNVRLGALQALRSMTTAADDLLEPVAAIISKEADPRLIAEAFEVLRMVGAKAEPHLIEGLKGASEQVRLLSIQKLREIKSDKALDSVAAMFANETAEPVRAEAFEYLKSHGLKAEGAFLKALESKQPEIRNRAIEGLAEIQSEKAYEGIAKLFRSEKDPKVIEKCFEYLKRMRQKAEPEFLFALKMDNLDIRQRAIRELGYNQSIAAIPELMGLLHDLNPALKDAARQALVLIGPKAIEAIHEAAKAGKLKEEERDQILLLYDRAGVEKLLLGMISEQGGIGYFPGIFDPLAKFGKERAVRVLLRIVLEEEYRPAAFDQGDAALNWDYVRCLALMALGELGDAEVLKKVKALSMEGRDSYWHSEWAVTRHKLGDPAELDGFVKKALADFEKAATLDPDRQLEAYRALIMAARMLMRTGRKAEALDCYQKYAKGFEAQKDSVLPREQYCNALYNSACLLAALGKKGEAVQALERAVDAGFRDLGWIKMDRDLEPIRDEEAYKKLVAEPEKFKPRE